MRIEAPDNVSQPNVCLWLTVDEARELRDALDEMLAQGPEVSWHRHVSSADYQTEVTITWESAARA